MTRLVLGMVITMTAVAAERTVYVGTYTREGKSKGIERLLFNEQTGAIKLGELAVETENPSFLALHPTKAVLYSVTNNPQTLPNFVASAASSRGGRTGQLF